MSELSGARCVGQPELFESTHPLDHREAAAICAGCPARRECLELLRGERGRYGTPSGTWAGLLIGARGKPVLIAPREHGTEKGYYQHKNRGERACVECCDAMAAATQIRRKTQVKATNRTSERVEFEADKRSPSRVLGRSATEASTDYEGVGS